jgi:V/A-type H+-transporting ATPase subunit I
MYKYGFFVYHQEYADFLNDIQQLGVLHVVEREHEGGFEIMQKSVLVNRIEKMIQFLEKRNPVPKKLTIPKDASAIVDEIAQKQELLENLNQELEAWRKERQKVIPWGDFSTELIQKLKIMDLNVRFFMISKKKFTSQFQENYHAELISENERFVYFILIEQGQNELIIDAEEMVIPEHSVSELEKYISTVENKIQELNNDFDSLAASAIHILKTEKEQIQTALEFDQVILNTQKEFGDQLMILEGWVPSTMKMQIDEYLEKKHIIFISEKATPKDKAPILLQNGRFSKLFEPIGKIFSLPAYYELDLTVFFAPFFMLFFGFCLGDAGYGLLFLIGAGLYKLTAPNAIKPYLTLIQYLGMAAILFGIVSGTLFGINLIETDITLTSKIRSLFLKPASMFNLALLLGAVQIIFGMCLKAANQIKQYGFVYGLGTFGWLFIILGCVVYLVLTNQKIIESNKLILYSILLVGGFFILFFSDPEAGIFIRFGKGIWDIYSTVTGIFGDLLSYIRLFAIGLSSSILGYVINDIGLTILHASPVIGPVMFTIFLLVGHTLNIMISTLGSFVHPMRLTFVEFYKNAGFIGGGKEYKPFLKYNNR